MVVASDFLSWPLSLVSDAFLVSDALLALEFASVDAPPVAEFVGLDAPPVAEFAGLVDAPLALELAWPPLRASEPACTLKVLPALESVWPLDVPLALETA